MRENKLHHSIDWSIVAIYLALLLFGWINIYAAVYDPEVKQSIFSMDYNSGKQLVWIFASGVLIVFVLAVDFRIYEQYAFIIYGFLIFLLILVLFVGVEIAGSRSWFDLGVIGFSGARLQPAEFAKFGTALALSGYLNSTNKRADEPIVLIISFAILALPAALIILQGDTGSALVYSSLVLVLYREGFPGVILVVGVILVSFFVVTLFFREDSFDTFITTVAILGVVSSLASYLLVNKRKKIKVAVSVFVVTLMLIFMAFSMDYILVNILKPHQRARIEVLVDPYKDPKGSGWNVIQSKVAIGSGGFGGKGFLQGTQTKFDFVPEQSTDFIFCTVGEEYGWIGSMIIISLFTTLLFRVVALAERQKSRFARVYGYSVASIIFFHFTINIGMTIGLFPVIGIPLPYFSYGGSSLWSFTILLFILLKLDGHRSQVLAR
ncbi:rod shape-determining protein RodA [Chondrinema litorale]|uniref:rod shape-determining protein RodA n=1 Tax=Chondrinema litorale TaxID=2994555 RepID=UPI002542A8D2|nr:rod shape-determining protein RodA [Chondrinema litorale]UZR92758.1 rod shape-determining protein RodA [Chondrinema litorale]